MMIERRTEERMHASLPARLAFGGRYRVRGVVLNISGVGARLALDKSGDVPAEFVLSVCYKRQERHYRAEVRWRKREALGLGLKPLPATEGEWLQGLARTRHSEDAVMDRRGTRLFQLADEGGHTEQKPERAF
jgi:hypothetical protein